MEKGHAFCCALEEDHMKQTVFGKYTLISMYEYSCLVFGTEDTVTVASDMEDITAIAYKLQYV